LKRRFRALVIDYFTIIIFAVILLAINLFIYLVILKGFPNFNELGMNLVSLILLLPVVLCSIIMESNKKHGTIGKRKMKIIVTSVKSDHIKLWQIILRNIIKFLPCQIAHMMIFHGFTLNWNFTPLFEVMFIVTDLLPFLYIGVVVLRKDHRGLPDLISKTVVVENHLF